MRAARATNGTSDQHNTQILRISSPNNCRGLTNFKFWSSCFSIFLYTRKWQQWKIEPTAFACCGRHNANSIEGQAVSVREPSALGTPCCTRALQLSHFNSVIFFKILQPLIQKIRITWQDITPTIRVYATVRKQTSSLERNTWPLSFNSGAEIKMLDRGSTRKSDFPVVFKLGNISSITCLLETKWNPWWSKRCQDSAWFQSLEKAFLMISEFLAQMILRDDCLEEKFP